MNRLTVHKRQADRQTEREGVRQRERERDSVSAKNRRPFQEQFTG